MRIPSATHTGNRVLSAIVWSARVPRLVEGSPLVQLYAIPSLTLETSSYGPLALFIYE